MKYVKVVLIAISCLLFGYLLLFTDAAFGANLPIWIVLITISCLVFGMDYLRLRKVRKNRNEINN